MSELTISFTGHRPDKLGGYSEEARDKLLKFALVKLKQINPKHCITGMALGWDMAIAEACVGLNIPYTAAVPFPEQPNVWNKKDQERWKFLIEHAAKVVYVSDKFSIKALQDRNEWMVDNSDALICMHDGSKGGTFNCIKYAKKQKKPMINLYPDFAMDSSPTALFHLYLKENNIE